MLKSEICEAPIIGSVRACRVTRAPSPKVPRDLAGVGRPTVRPRRMLGEHGLTPRAMRRNIKFLGQLNRSLCAALGPQKAMEDNHVRLLT